MSTDRTPRALVIGEALVDVTSTPDGAVREHPGGSPLNVAVTLARQGIDTTLASQVGDDRHGEIVRAHLDGSGVRLVTVHPSAPTASATATLGMDGSATYAFDLRWAPEHLPDPTDYDLVHVGSIGAWLAPGADAVADLVRRAHALGLPVGFDPNVRPALAPPVPELRRRVVEIAAHSRFVKVSDEDAAALAPDCDPSSVVGELAAQGAAITAMTRGSGPTVLWSGGEQVEVPATVVEVADTIGAGDTWMGTLLAEVLLRSWGDRTEFDADALRALGRAAADAAAITVSRPGADPPWRPA